jgi:hypothetical protein
MAGLEHGDGAAIEAAAVPDVDVDARAGEAPPAEPSERALPGGILPSEAGNRVEVDLDDQDEALAEAAAAAEPEARKASLNLRLAEAQAKAEEAKLAARILQEKRQKLAAENRKAEDLEAQKKAELAKEE